MDIKDKEGLKKFFEEELGVRKLTDEELYKYTEVSRQAFSRWHNVGIMPRPIYFLLKGISSVRKLTPKNNPPKKEWTKGRVDKVQGLLDKKRNELDYPYKYNKEEVHGTIKLTPKQIDNLTDIVWECDTKKEMHTVINEFYKNLTA